MPKIICYIPARLGSQRVPKKNLRLISGKPLITYAIEAAKEAKVFDDIYVNSEADILGEIASKWQVKFYKRPAEFSSDTAVNDDFAFDFIKNNQADIVLQFLPTSPLIEPGKVKDFVDEMIKGDFDTLISVIDQQIACVFEGKGVNFTPMEKHKSSQNMIPVKSYASVLVAWKRDKFLDNMQKHGFAYHGADGKTGYYSLRGLSNIDIDHEEDFILAEVAINFKNNKNSYEKKYYQGGK